MSGRISQGMSPSSLRPRSIAGMFQISVSLFLFLIQFPAKSARQRSSSSVSGEAIARASAHCSRSTAVASAFFPCAESTSIRSPKGARRSAASGRYFHSAPPEYPDTCFQLLPGGFADARREPRFAWRRRRPCVWVRAGSGSPETRGRSVRPRPDLPQ